MQNTTLSPHPPNKSLPGSLGGLPLQAGDDGGTRLPVCIPVVSHTPGVEWLSFPRGWFDLRKYSIVAIPVDGKFDAYNDVCAVVDDFGSLVAVPRA